MRILLIENKEVRHFEHFVSQVRMRVEQRRHNGVRTDDAATCSYQIALAVIFVFSNHRAVQIQQNDIAVCRLLQIAQN